MTTKATWIKTLQFKNTGVVEGRRRAVRGGEPGETGHGPECDCAERWRELAPNRAAARRDSEREPRRRRSCIFWASSAVGGIPWGGAVPRGIPGGEANSSFCGRTKRGIGSARRMARKSWIGTARRRFAETKDARSGQAGPGVRWFTKSVQHPDVIQAIFLESFDNKIAPTFVAITAEIGDGSRIRCRRPARCRHDANRF